MTIAAITGLEAEARIARRAGLAARASGGIAAGTIEAAEACLAAGAEGLVSFGIAGALAPHLAPGSLVLPRVVVETDGARHDVDENWRARVRDRLIAAGLGIDEGDILGAAEAIATVERKAALHVATGAVAVDLESHIVARAARHSARPFLVLRAVADPAAQALPAAALDGLDAAGVPALGRVLASLVRNPAQLPDLLRLAGNTRRALFALRSALGAGLA